MSLNRLKTNINCVPVSQHFFLCVTLLTSGAHCIIQRCLHTSIAITSVTRRGSHDRLISTTEILSAIMRVLILTQSASTCGITGTFMGVLLPPETPPVRGPWAAAAGPVSVNIDYWQISEGLEPSKLRGKHFESLENLADHWEAGLLRRLPIATTKL